MATTAEQAQVLGLAQAQQEPAVVATESDGSAVPGAGEPTLAEATTTQKATEKTQRPVHVLLATTGSVASVKLPLIAQNLSSVSPSAPIPSRRLIDQRRAMAVPQRRSPGRGDRRVAPFLLAQRRGESRRYAHPALAGPRRMGRASAEPRAPSTISVLIG